jgi:hypothetical protein
VRKFFASIVFGAAVLAAPSAVLATGSGDGSANCTVSGPVRCEGGDPSSGGSTGDTLPPKTRVTNPPVTTTPVTTTPVTTVPVTTTPVTTVTTLPAGVPQQNQVSPGTPQETQVSPGTPVETQVSPGTPAENTSSNTNAGSTSPSVAANNKASGNSIVNNSATAGSILERVSTSVLEQSGLTVPRVLVTSGAAAIMDPADSFKLAAAAPKPALSHLWPESFIAGLALGLTAYGAVVVARRRQERSVSDADLDLFLTSSTSENQETSTDLLKV